MSFRAFLGIVSLIFSRFWHGARIPREVFRDRGKFFCPENWENGREMGQKQGFLNLLENLVINFY